MASSRIRLDKLDPNNPLALKIRAALVAEDDKAKGLVPTGVQTQLTFQTASLPGMSHQNRGGDAFDRVPEVLVVPGVNVIQEFTTVKKIKQFDMRRLVSGANAYDSTEEYEFEAWCNDAQKLGLVVSYVYHPPAFKLSDRVAYPKLVKMKTKVKEVEAFLFHPHEYTPDFDIQLTEQGIKFLKDRKLFIWPPPRKMYGPIRADTDHMCVDVKGGFSIYHDDKPFSINQKWVFDKYGVYVYKVVPRDWFKKTWAPRAALYSPKKGKLRECYKGTETFETIKEKL